MFFKNFSHLTTKAFIISMIFISQSQARSLDSQHHSFQTQTIANDLEHPWGMAFLPGGDLLVTERSGRLRLIRSGKLEAEPITGLPDIVARGQGGLLDVQAHPNFEENRLIYLSLVAPGKNGFGTEVVRGRLSLDQTEFLTPEVIFKMEPKSRSPFHFGSRLVFDHENFLFISLGDRGDKDQSQNLNNHLGSVIRIHDDGRIPEDNPFINDPNAQTEIYSYGHRNVQGLTLHSEKNQIWSHEHGPRGGDEINLIEAGKNYGWPVITYGIDYDGSIISNETHHPDMKQPLWQWTPSIAPCGMVFYHGDLFEKWSGDLFVGALAYRHLQRLRIKNGKVIEQEKLLESLNERIRDVEISPDGLIYVLTDSPNGSVISLKSSK